MMTAHSVISHALQLFRLRLSYREGGTQAKAVALFSDMMSSLYTGTNVTE